LTDPTMTTTGRDCRPAAMSLSARRSARAFAFSGTSL
jgi:hypothetical protein